MFKASVLLAMVFTVAGSGHLFPWGAQVASAQTAKRPNVLIFVTDDQRATNTLWVMPKTKRYFQRGGVRFTNAFSVTPLCCPSRATIFTGRYAHNTGVHGNGPPRTLDPTTVFPRLLGRAGYRTAMVGKFLNSWPANRPPPFFDRFASGGSPYHDPEFNINGTMKTVNGYATRVVGDFATRFLHGFESNDSAPWFLYVAPHAPHHPWTPEASHRFDPVGHWRGNPAVRESDRSDKPAYVRKVSYSLADAQSVRSGQLRALMSVDDMVGRVFATLRRLGERRRTLAIFTSDNGFTWAEHGLGGDRTSAGQKRTPYTGSVKIPFLLRWPGHVAGGRRDRRLTGTVDIAPTVLDAARVAADPTKPPLDGHSILSAVRRRRIVLEYWREHWIPTWASLRTHRYQYIEYYSETGRRFFREYYDLVRDPWQLRNLLHDGNPRNNPNVAAVSSQLRHDHRCRSTSGLSACP